jgi:peptidoglycan DL-endopeptidase LytE
MSIYKSLILSCTFIMFVLLAAHQAHADQSDTGVKVQVNDEILVTPDDQPFLDTAGHLQVPLRLVMEKIGLTVHADIIESKANVTLTNSKQSIKFQTGESQVQVNDNLVKLESPAVYTQGKVFISLRFVSDALGIRIQWDEKNRIAILDFDGQYHAPAWYAPETSPVTQMASSYLGVPYVWGGTTPNGFDCSGFVRYVYQQTGVELPRTSLDMYATVGTSVTDLKPGDLVFFANKNKVDHVGIYIGNNQFISAANKGVKIDSLASQWGDKYVGAKRIA